MNRLKAENRSGRQRIPIRMPALAAVSGAIYVLLSWTGDLREHLALFLASYGLLTLAMVLAWRTVVGQPRALRWALGAALLFRLIAAVGPPALSDDVQRYVWDGRVQWHGVHPYAHAPDAPELVGLRDESWPRINHPDVKTIYPPIAQIFFAAVAATGARATGFKLALGLVDFAVVLLLGHLLVRRSMPLDRVILYAWNPLAVLETAGSGHVEPLGLLLLLLAAIWIIDRRPNRSTIAVAVAAQVKILPVALVPGLVRRGGVKAIPILLLALLIPVLPYAFGGPTVGAGLYAYAERWEHNATFYAVIEGLYEQIDVGDRLKPVVAALHGRYREWNLPWDFLYRHVWPRDVARLTVALLAAVWILFVALRLRPGFARENLLVVGALLLLSPTLYPWYLLWVLPWAVLRLSWGWLVLAATIPLAYLGDGGDVSWGVKAIEYLPPLCVAAWCFGRRARRPGESI